MTKYYYAFREMDGDWSQWYSCSEEYYNSHQNMIDCMVKKVTTKVCTYKCTCGAK